MHSPDHLVEIAAGIQEYEARLAVIESFVIGSAIVLCLVVLALLFEELFHDRE